MTIKKGIAVLNGTTVVHKFSDDGDALVGADGQRVDLKGSVFVDGVTGHAGTDLATTINAIMATDGGDLQTEVDRAIAAEAAIAASISGEYNRAVAAEGALANAINAEQARASAVESTLTTDVSTQVAAAKAVESQLNQDIGLEVIRAGGAETTNANAISTESSRAVTAEVALQNALVSQVATSQAAEAALQSDVDQNEADFDAAILAREKAAKAAEATLSSDLATQVSNAKSAESTNATDLATQKSAAQTEESTLSTGVTNQSTSAQAVEIALAGAIAAEDVRASAAEAGLQAQLDTITDVLNDPKTLETFRDVIEDFADQDTATETAITNALNAHQAAREQATADGIARVATLQATEDGNEATFDAAIASRSSDAQTAEATLTSNLNAQSAAAQAAEAALQADVDQNEVDFFAGRDTVFSDAKDNWQNFSGDSMNSSVAQEKERSLIAVETTIQNLLDAEEARATAAENAINSALDDEGAETWGLIQQSQGAEYVIQADVDQNEADFDAALAAIQTDEIENLNMGVKRIKEYEEEKSSSSTGSGQEFTAVSNDNDTNESDFDTALAAQIKASQAAEAGLQSDIDGEIARATAAEATLTSDLANQVTAAKAAESANATATTDEDTRSAAARAAIQASIDAEVARATAAELALTNALAAQTASAQAAEVAIQADLDVLLDISNPAIAGSMKEVVDAFEAMDQSMKNTHDAQIVTYQTELQAQINAATAEETSLQQEEDSNEALFDANIAAQEAATVAWEDSYFAGFGALVDQNNGNVYARDLQTQAMDAMGNDVIGLLEMTVGQLVVQGPLTPVAMGDGIMAVKPVPANYTDAAELAAGNNDGKVFYYNGSATPHFPLSNKHYFCEAGVWYASPFYTPPVAVDTTALFAAADAVIAFQVAGGTDAAQAQGLMDAAETEIFALSANPMVAEGYLQAQYPNGEFDDAMSYAQSIANPPSPMALFRITPTAGYGYETYLIAPYGPVIAPLSAQIGGDQMGSATTDWWFDVSVDGTWQMSDDWGDGAYTLEICRSDGSVAQTLYHSAGFKYSDGQFETFDTTFDGTTLTVNGTPVLTFDSVTGDWS